MLFDPYSWFYVLRGPLHVIHRKPPIMHIAGSYRPDQTDISVFRTQWNLYITVWPNDCYTGNRYTQVGYNATILLGRGRYKQVPFYCTYYGIPVQFVIITVYTGNYLYNRFDVSTLGRLRSS